MHARIGCGASPGVPARGLAAAEVECAPIRTTRHPGPGGTGRDGAWGVRAAPRQSEAWDSATGRSSVPGTTKPPHPSRLLVCENPSLLFGVLDVTVCI